MDETRAQLATSRFAAALCALPLGLLRWSPIWVPLLLFAQIALLGLHTSRAENRRLEVEEQRLELRRAGLIQENTGLEARLRAHRDPIYLERERRLEAHRLWAEQQVTREALAAALAPPATPPPSSAASTLEPAPRTPGGAAGNPANPESHRAGPGGSGGGGSERAEPRRNAVR